MSSWGWFFNERESSREKKAIKIIAHSLLLYCAYNIEVSMMQFKLSENLPGICFIVAAPSWIIKQYIECHFNFFLSRGNVSIDTSKNFHNKLQLNLTFFWRKIFLFSFRQIFQSPWSPRSPKYEFELMEEQPINTILTTLHATDADSTIAEFQLIDGPADNGNEYFEINNVTGKHCEHFLPLGRVLFIRF